MSEHPAHRSGTPTRSGDDLLIEGGRLRNLDQERREATTEAARAADPVPSLPEGPAKALDNENGGGGKQPARPSERVTR